MSVHAGTILHLGGNNVIDRIQRAGLGNVNVPQDSIREVGNVNIVDKVPGDPDFTFTLETLDVSCELEAWMTGKWSSTLSSADETATALADGTAFSWQQAGFVNVVSPWKDPASSGGTVVAGHIVPGYYATRIRYQFGVTDNATTTLDLSGGSFYYNGNAPVEDRFTSGGTAFVSTHPAVAYRRGGASRTSRPTRSRSPRRAPPRRS
jgi:hypothetical protein